MEENNHTKNIVVFGETGTGKSSIINMLAGKPVADVSGGASGCTPISQCYSISYRNEDSYMFWDTPGLNGDPVSSQAAVQNIVDLVKTNGVSLLIYCVRERIPNIIRVNYDLFWKIICRKRVPIVLVVTGLEGRQEMDDWWRENWKTMRAMKMSFVGHACITSWKGRNNANEKEYKESAEKVWQLVREYSGVPWHMAPDWPLQAQKDIKTYEESYNATSANGIRKILQELLRFFSL